MYRLLQETPEDWWEVEYLYDLSFAPGREALSSYRLRESVPPVAELCYVARDAEDVLAGAIRYWPVLVGVDRVDAILLGPIAVHPTRQGEGLGGALMRQTLEIAKNLGMNRVILVGDEPYYGRFGFKKSPLLKYPPPVNPNRILSLGLVDGAFDDVTGLVEPAVNINQSSN